MTMVIKAILQRELVQNGLTLNHEIRDVYETVEFTGDVNLQSAFVAAKALHPDALLFEVYKKDSEHKAIKRY